MERYRYKARTMDGRKRKGTAEAGNEKLLLKKLKEEGLFCFWYVRESRKDPLPSSGKIKRKELSFFCHQMSAMVQAQVPITKAIRICGQTSENNVRGLLDRLNDQIERGYTLSEAMGRLEHAFPELMVRVVEAGEKSGRLGQLLEKMGKRFERESRLEQKVRNVMTYPAILLAVTVACSLFLFAAVIPQFAVLLSGSSLPVTTRVMLKISHFLTEYPLLFCLSWGVALAGIWGIFQIPAVRLQASRIQMTLPVVGKLIRISNGARFACSFSILYGSGVGALESMETAGRMMNHVYARKRMKDFAEAVRSGSPLSEVFSGESLFPPAFAAMVAAGEESGQLAGILERAGEFYEGEEEGALEQLLALLEPAMILLMGLIVGTVVLSVLIPLYSLYSQML